MHIPGFRNWNRKIEKVHISSCHNDRYQHNVRLAGNKHLFSFSGRGNDVLISVSGQHKNYLLSILYYYCNHFSTSKIVYLKFRVSSIMPHSSPIYPDIIRE